MADVFDQTQDRLEREQELRDLARPVEPYEPPPGVAGECERCWEESARLINGVCARCRDKHGLP
jgi:hypothetical protein